MLCMLGLRHLVRCVRECRAKSCGRMSWGLSSRWNGPRRRRCSGQRERGRERETLLGNNLSSISRCRDDRTTSSSVVLWPWEVRGFVLQPSPHCFFRPAQLTANRQGPFKSQFQEVLPSSGRFLAECGRYDRTLSARPDMNEIFLRQPLQIILRHFSASRSSGYAHQAIGPTDAPSAECARSF